jgi:hypothetical protein
MKATLQRYAPLREWAGFYRAQDRARERDGTGNRLDAARRAGTQGQAMGTITPQGVEIDKLLDEAKVQTEWVRREAARLQAEGRRLDAQQAAIAEFMALTQLAAAAGKLGSPGPSTKAVEKHVIERTIIIAPPPQQTAPSGRGGVQNRPR